MKIDKPHSQYEQYINDWVKCRDAKEGQSAIHKAKEKYLPKLSGQTDNEYKAYRDRTCFYGATSRTIDGLTGMLFRKPVQIKNNGFNENILSDVDLMGNDIQSFTENLADEIITVGRAGVLVDFPQVDSQGLSVASAMRLNARPFIKLYSTESVFNWHYTRINNKKVLSHVYLHEIISEPANEYEFDDVEQIRLLILIEGVYKQIIFRKNKKHEWIIHDEIIPLANGDPLDYIPFIFVNSMGSQSDVTKPPLIDLVNTNISHYKTTADLEHGSHFTGLPTAVITGFNSEEDQDFRIGSSSAWVFSNPETEVKYLEFEGKGLETLENLLARKESMMASLGSQMLTPDTRRNESAETSALRHSGEHATLASVSISITHAINKAFYYMTSWLGNVEPAVIQVNRDFNPTKLDPQMMQQLFLALQGGRISHQTYFDNLKAGEIIASEKMLEDELDEIQAGL